VPDAALKTTSDEQSDLGDEARVSGDTLGALGHWRASITVNPCNAHAWASIGSTLIDNARPADGALAYEAATTLLPKNPRFWLELGRAREGTGAWSDAVVAYQEALYLQDGLTAAAEGLRRAARAASTPP
jgi:cytochrome c-type biogenesis protein CcmH/NrfG